MANRAMIEQTLINLSQYMEDVEKMDRTQIAALSDEELIEEFNRLMEV